MSNDHIDPEKDGVHKSERPISTSISQRANSADTQDKHAALELFQLLVGIHTPPHITRDGDQNVSLYQNAKAQARAARLAYTMTGLIANSLYMLQIMFAAIFTGLSAYKKTTSVTLTSLGAINTVIAGSLAWQKGQGVPQRYRKARDEYDDLILQIEMTERAFFDPATAQHLDPRTEATRLQHLYDTARADQQANYPDLYVSTAGKNQKFLTKQDGEDGAGAAQVQK